jgi:FAD:protein FMN transferase
MHHVEHVMGMAVTIDVRDLYVPVGAIEEVVAWLHHVDAVFSPYKDDSVVTRFGRGEITADELPTEMRDVLHLCDLVRNETGGAFDVFRLPAVNGTMFDPSGMVKGWSIQRAAEILESWSAEDFSINAGGDIVLRGSPTPGTDEPWRTGIRHPEIADKLACVVSSGSLAIATSATYERGQHIIDPRTGEPATGMTSVTIVGPDLTWADAYATAVFVLGIDALTWVEAHEGYGAYAITPDNMTYSTPTFDLYR